MEGNRVMFNIDFSSVTNSWRFLLDGAAFTLELTLVAVAGGLLLGTLIAVARLSHKWWLKTLASAYVNAIRSVPLVLLLFWVFFLMPELLRYLVGASRPVTVEASVSAMVTFVVFEAAYFAEIIRAGIGSVKSGQLAAAAALGLNYAQTMRFVILPQAVKHMLPVLLTQVIVVFQDTSLVYVISANDFLGACSKIAQRDSQLILMYLLAAVVYLTVSLALSRSVRRFEKRGALTH